MSDKLSEESRTNRSLGRINHLKSPNSPEVRFWDMMRDIG